MTIIGLLVFIVLVGVILWLINQFIPMSGAIKTLLNVVVFILLVIYVLEFFGVIPHLIPLPSHFNF